jgi:hypothetical protein
MPEPTAVDSVIAYFAARLGETVKRADLVDALAAWHTSTAVDQALELLRRRGKLERVGHARSGRYRRTEQDAAPAAPTGHSVGAPPAGPRPPAAAPAVPASQRPGPAARSPEPDPEVPRRVGKVTTLTFKFADPPSPPASESDETLRHLRSLIVRLKERPGQWAQIALIEGTPQSAAMRAVWLGKELNNPDVQLQARRHFSNERGGGSRHGIYARYRESH